MSSVASGEFIHLARVSTSGQGSARLIPRARTWPKLTERQRPCQVHWYGQFWVSRGWLEYVWSVDTLGERTITHSRGCSRLTCVSYPHMWVRNPEFINKRESASHQAFQIQPAFFLHCSVSAQDQNTTNWRTVQVLRDNHSHKHYSTWEWVPQMKLIDLCSVSCLWRPILDTW